MRGVIIEDERPSLELMKRMVEKNGLIDIVGAYTDPTKALDDIPRLSPDVIFADVEMPGMNGMDLAGKVKRLDEEIQIVFVTAYEKYAIDAFRVNAVNYILKPITAEDLDATVNRLLKGFRRRALSAASENKRRIVTFGCFTVYGSRQDRKVRWPTAKVRELFACFVLNQGEALEKWQLCERLWPQAHPPQAEHSLHSAVSRMRKSLQDTGIPNAIVYGEGRYRMDMGGLSCDLWELQELLENHPPVCNENIARYEKALNLYRGDLFGTEDYPWCLAVREKYRLFYINCVKNIGRYYLAQKDCRQAEKYLQKSVNAEPTDEEAALLLLEAYFSMGNKEKLVDCYAKLKTAVKEELGIEPQAETTRLYTDLLRRL